MLPVEPATAEDVAALHGLRRRLEDWLHDRGIRQWPRGEVPPERIAAQLTRGEWHVLRGATGVIAALRLLWSDPDFWGADETPAVYVHGLMVDRMHAGRGLGASLVDWAADTGRARGAAFCRLDCAESNGALREFYRRLGFREVGRRAFAHLHDVTLFEKPLSAASGSRPC